MIALLIDGEFQQSLSVSPKEILNLLKLGTIVIGASSMGALRAAELGKFGMQGVGWVYEQYRSGAIIDDSEVALLYAGPSYISVTVPMVNLRYRIESAEAKGDLSRASAKEITDELKSIHYSERTKNRVKAVLHAHASPEIAFTIMGANMTPKGDIKHADALSALKIAENIFTGQCASPTPTPIPIPNHE